MKKILINFGIVVVLFVSSYFSYLIGLSSANEPIAIFFMPLAKQQYECIDKNDKDCLKKSNEMLIDFVNTAVTSLRDKGFNVDKKLIEHINEYENWYNAKKNHLK